MERHTIYAGNDMWPIVYLVSNNMLPLFTLLPGNHHKGVSKCCQSRRAHEYKLSAHSDSSFGELEMREKQFKSGFRHPRGKKYSMLRMNLDWDLTSSCVSYPNNDGIILRQDFHIIQYVLMFSISLGSPLAVAEAAATLPVVHWLDMIIKMGRTVREWMTLLNDGNRRTIFRLLSLNLFPLSSFWSFVRRNEFQRSILSHHDTLWILIKKIQPIL